MHGHRAGPFLDRRHKNGCWQSQQQHPEEWLKPFVPQAKARRGFLLSSFRDIFLQPLELEIFQFFFFFFPDLQHIMQLNPVAHKGLKCLIFNSAGTWISLLKSSTLFYETLSFLFSPQKIPVEWSVMLRCKVPVCSCGIRVMWMENLYPKTLLKGTRISSILI